MNKERNPFISGILPILNCDLGAASLKAKLSASSISFLENENEKNQYSCAQQESNSNKKEDVAVFPFAFDL